MTTDKGPKDNPPQSGNDGSTGKSGDKSNGGSNQPPPQNPYDVFRGLGEESNPREQTGYGDFGANFGAADNVDFGEPLINLAPENLERKRNVFVKPEEYEKLFVDDKRIFFVAAEDIDGTTTVAINLADKIILQHPDRDRWSERADEIIYTNDSNNLQEINDVLRSTNQEYGIFIIKRIIERGVSASELSSERLALYQTELKKRNSYIVLTLTTEEEKRVNLPPESTLSYNTVDRSAVFESHLEYDFQKEDDAKDVHPLNRVKREILEENRQLIIDVANPSQIGAIFRRFKNEQESSFQKLRISNQSDQDEKLKQEFEVRLINIIEDVTNIQRRTRDFFGRLNFNERVFGMLIALLEVTKTNGAVNLFDTEELYHLTTNAMLRSMNETQMYRDEKSLNDARTTGIHDLMEKLGISDQGENDESIVRFQDKIVRNNFLQQTTNYHRLLWTLDDLLIDIVDGQVKYFLHPEIGLSVIARLIGYFGIYQERRLRNFFNKLIARNSIQSISLIAQTLPPIATRPEHHEFIRTLLDDWVPGKSNQSMSQLQKILLSSQVLPNVMVEVTRLVSETQNNKDVDDTYKFLKRLFKRLISQSVKHTQDTQSSQQQFKNAIDEEAQKLIQVVEDFDSISTEKRDEFKQNIIRERNERVSEYTALTVIEWLKQSLILVFLTYDTVVDRGNEILINDTVDLLIDQINQGLMQDRGQDLLEYLQDSYVNRIVQELSYDDTGQKTDGEEDQKLSNEKYFTNAEWYLSVAIANHLFIERGASEVSKVIQSTNEELGDDDTTTEDHNEVGDEEASTNNQDIETDDETTETIEEDDKVIDIKDELDELDPPSFDVSANEQEQDNQQTDRKQPVQQRQNIIDLYQYLRPLMRLLPVMLKATPYYGNLQTFFSSIQQGEELNKHYKKYSTTKHLEASIRFGGDNYQDKIANALTQSPIQIALGALLDWFGLVNQYPDAAQSWLDIVYPAMLQMVNKASQKERSYLRDALFLAGWFTSPYADIRRMARSLVARAYIMDGYVMDLPLLAKGKEQEAKKKREAERYGVVLLDATSNPFNTLFFGRQLYYQRAYNLIQRLSAMVPIKVAYLGYTSEMHLFGVPETKAVRSPNQLQPRRRRDRLIFPSLESMGFPERDPSNLHFVLTFSTIHIDDNERQEIVDMGDIISSALGSDEVDVQVNEWDPFAEANANDTPDTDAEMVNPIIEWSWRNKLLFLSSTPVTLRQELENQIFNSVKNSEYLNLNLSSDELIQLIPVKQGALRNWELSVIEDELHKHIVNMIWALPTDTMRENLERYQLGVDFNNTENVIQNLEEWVVTLDDQEKANHPRDISLTIAWSILMLASEDIKQATALLSSWLESDDILKQRMASALTQLLFNYYNATEITEHMDAGREILNLLVPYVDTTQESDELTSIIEINLNWAQASLWARELATGTAFLSAIRKIKNRSVIRRVLQLVSFREILIGLQTMYTRIGLDFDQYRQLLQDITNYVQKYTVSARTDIRQDVTSEVQKHGINLEMATLEELEILLNYDIFQDNVTRNILMQTLEYRVETQSNQIKQEEQEIIYRNIKAVADSIRMTLYHKLGDDLPPIRDTQKYGIIIVDVSSSAAGVMMPTSIALMRNLQRELTKQKRTRDVVFTVHRVGRRELVYSGVKGAPSQKQLRVERIRHDPKLIGSILDSYDPQQVGFAVVLTGNDIVDIGDWAEQSEWYDHLWLHTTSRSQLLASDVIQGSQRNRNTKKDVRELTNEILRKLDQS